MSFSVCKLFCCFLTGGIEGIIILAIMNSPLRCLYDLAPELIVGKIMYKFDKQCKSYFGAREHLFIYLLLFILLLNYVAPNAFGIAIWGILGRVWPTEWHTCYCERFQPRSHFKSRLSLIVRVNVVRFTRTIKLNLHSHVIVHTTLT